MIRRVLFAVRGDLTTRPGGDSVQALGTAAALRRLGLEVTIAGPGEADPSWADVVHLWHLERVHDAWAHLEAARAAGRPVVLSTIYWPRGGRARRVVGGVAGRVAWAREDAKNLVRWWRSGGADRGMAWAALARGWASARRDLLAQPRVLLPNSEAEGRILQEEARLGGLRCPPCHVVVNAIEPEELPTEAMLESRVAGPAAPIVSVGHFDPRKNQRGLIAALRSLASGPGMKGESMPGVVMVGAARRHHRGYERQCRAMARGMSGVTFAGALARGEALAVLGRGMLHVCPSSLETPGLANLEAAAMGLGLVVPDCPPVREYFGAEPGVWYFEPGRDESLARAMREAWGAIRSTGRPGVAGPLARRVRERYTWARAAEQTLRAYEAAVEGQ